MSGSHPSWATPAAKRGEAPAGQRIGVPRVPEHAQPGGHGRHGPGRVQPGKRLVPPLPHRRPRCKASFDPTDASVATVRSWLTSQDLSVAARPGQQPVRVGHRHRGPGRPGLRRRPRPVHGARASLLRSPDQELTRAGRRSAGSVRRGRRRPVAATCSSPTTSRPTRRRRARPPAPAPPRGQPAAPPRPARPAPKVPQPDGFRNAHAVLGVLGRAGRHHRSRLTATGSAPAALRAVRLHPAPAASGLRDRHRWSTQGLDGRSTTVAIVDAFASPSIYKDASTYARRNDPTHPLPKSQFSQIIFKPTVDARGQRPVRGQRLVG